MNICDIFFSLQGESTYAGLPCIFIRLAGCNLRCRYCDTPESFDVGQDFDLDQILLEIRKYPCQLVELTGGEPLLQSGSLELMEQLATEGYQVLLETNGSLSIQTVPSTVQIIIDVKLPGSGQPDCFLLSNLQWLKAGRDELKFVVSHRADFDAALAFIQAHDLYKHTLLFSPVTGELDPAALAAWIMETGLPLRLNLQLHKLLNLK
jgi:7-carboxy-7-deazaguanine synthase